MQLSDFNNSFLLLELAMNQKTFAANKKALADKAIVGFEFEFEFIVPKNSVMYVDGAKKKTDRDSIDISDIYGIDTLREYFNVSSYELRRIERFAEGWLEDKISDRVDAEWHDYLQPGEDEEDENAEEHAREAASEAIEAEYDDNPADIYLSFDGHALEIIDDFNLEPKFGWATTGRSPSVFIEAEENHDDEQSTTQQTYAALKKELADEYTDFYGNSFDIHQDLSIESDSGVGAELVTPPLPLDKALQSLHDVCKFLIDNHLVTNESTGFHINISFANRDIEDVDLLKLSLLLGEMHVLQQYDRTNNMYTEPQITKVVHDVHNGILDVKSALDHIIEVANARLKQTKKYSFFNVNHMKDGYIEFRAAGGEDYHANPNKLETTVLRFVTALQAAMDPSMYRQEYLKKVMKLFHIETVVAHTPDPHQTRTKFKDNPLARFISLNHTIGERYTEITSRNADISDRIYELSEMLAEINELIQRHKLTLTFAEKSAIRSLITKFKMDPRRVIDATKSSHADKTIMDPLLKSLGLV